LHRAGEVMTPLPARQALCAVLILPTQGCPTKDVYQAFDRLPIRDTPPTAWKKVAGMSAEELNGVVVNDLEAAAYLVAPWLRELRDLAEKAAGRRVMMTGSGSTLFTLAGSSVKAEEVKGRLERALPPEIGIVPVRIS